MALTCNMFFAGYCVGYFAPLPSTFYFPGSVNWAREAGVLRYSGGSVSKDSSSIHRVSRDG